MQQKIKYDRIKRKEDEETQEEDKMIGIIGAMDEEVAALKEAMETEETVERAGMGK